MLTCHSLSDVTLKPEENIYSASSLCYNWLVPTDENQTCGEAGIYNISHFLEIPEAGKLFIK